MNKSNNLPKTLPDMEYEFTLDVKGDLTQKQYSGNFKYQIPTIKMRAVAEKKRAELNSGLEDSLDPSVLNIHYMISYLIVTLVDAPTWWMESDYGYDLYDTNVIRALYDRVAEIEKGWIDTVFGPEETDGKIEKTKEGSISSN